MTDDRGVRRTSDPSALLSGNAVSGQVDSLLPFVPGHVREIGLPSGERSRVVRHTGAVLLSDIDGFTAMTSRIEAMNEGDAEEVALVLDAAFRRCIGAIHSHGGHIEGFGGDSVIALFFGNDAVRRASGAAEAIRQSLHGWSPEEAPSAPPLCITQVVSGGEIRCLILGGPENRCHTIQGQAVRRALEIESQVGGGSIETVVSGIRSECDPGSAAPASSEMSAPFVPRPVREILPTFEGAIVNATIMFVETAEVGVEEADRFFAELTAQLDDLGGILLKVLPCIGGIQWMCVFGTPVAVENGPARAGHLALKMVDAAPRRDRLRIGIHTGRVANLVLGTSARRVFDVIGAVVNIAARVTGGTAWGEIRSTDDAQLLMPGLVVRPLGTFDLRGVENPVRLVTIEGQERVERALDVVSPLIGRDGELDALTRRLNEVSQPQGARLAIRGAPGLGKSRLKYELVQQCKERGVAVHEGCSASFGDGPLEPVRRVLGAAFDLAGRDTLGQRRRLIELMGLPGAGLVGAMLGLSGSEKAPSTPGGAGRMRRAFRSIVDALVRVAQDSPRCLIFEDLHWSDPLTQSFLHALVATDALPNIFVLLLYRPEFIGFEEVPELVLPELTGADVRRMSQAIMGDVDESVMELVEERAGGNPLFVEETVRHLAESGVWDSDGSNRLTRELTRSDIPPSLGGLVQARLQKLAPDVRRVVQVAAAIGRTFSFALLDAVPEVSGRAISAIFELQMRELVFEVRGSSELRYVFKHSLVRDVAYHGILRSRRRSLHRSIAEAIQSGTDLGRSEELAHHWLLAGEIGKAQQVCLDGARSSLERLQVEAAEALARYGIEVDRRPSSTLAALRMELGSILLLTGRSVDATEQFRKGIDAARAAGALGEEIDGLVAIGRVRRLGGSYGDALESYRRAHRLTGTDPVRECRLLDEMADAYRAMGSTELAESCRESALSLAIANGEDELKGIVLLGRCELLVDRADYRGARDALEQARLALQGRGRHTEVRALLQDADLSLMEGEIGAARDLYDRVLRTSLEVNDRRTEGLALMGTAAIDSQLGWFDRARDTLEASAAIFLEIEDRPAEAAVMLRLAVVDRKQGMMSRAAARLETALGRFRASANRQGEACALRQRGELDSAMGRLEPAAASLLDALKISRLIACRRVELGVTSSLASWNLKSGNLDEARALFEKILPQLAEAGHRGEEARLLAEYAELLYRTGEPATAQDTCRRALDVARDLGDKNTMAIVRQLLGDLARNEGNPGTAREHYEAALGLAVETRCLPMEGLVRGSIAALRATQGRSREAEARYREALRIHEAVGNAWAIGVVLGNLALLKHGEGKVKEAQELYERALEAHRATGNRCSEAIVMSNLAQLKEEGGASPNEVLQEYRSALQVLRSVGNLRYQIVVLGNISGTENSLGHRESALECLEEALEGAQKLGDMWLQCQLLAAMGDLKLEAGDLTAAEAYYDTSLDSAGEQGPRLIALVRLRMGRLNRYLSRWDDASRHLRVAIEMLSKCGAQAEQLEALLERGHLELARGNWATSILSEVDRLVDAMPLPDAAPVARKVEQLRKAASSRNLLAFGALPEDTPPLLLEAAAKRSLRAD